MLSIIVALYNEEDNIEICVKSVLAQTLNEYELILVDDGSTDDSGQICDSYAKIDSRIKVIHKKNGGLISARMYGIKNAEGDYISFLDADDWVEPDFYERLYSPFTNGSSADISVSPYLINTRIGEEKNKFSLMEDGVISAEQAMVDMFFLEHFDWSACGKIYKKYIAEKHVNDWWFNEPIGEDLEWNWKVFQEAKNVYYVSKPGYHYRENMDSMSHQAIDMRNLVILDRLERMVNESENDLQLNQTMLLLCLRKTEEKYLRLLSFERDKVEELQKCADIISRLKGKNFNNLPESVNKRFKVLSEPLEKLLELNESNKESICENYRLLKNKSNKMYIYGAGTVAQYIAKILMENELDFDGFVVSKEIETGQQLLGKNVYSLQTVKESDVDAFFLIAADAKNSEEIKTMLISEGIKSYYEIGQHTFYY